MLSKEQIKNIFEKICVSSANFDMALDIYDNYLEKIADEKGIKPGTDEYAKLFENDEKEALPWLVEKLVNDKVVNFINENMEYVPIIEYPSDKALNKINNGIKYVIDFYKNEHGNNFGDIRPNIFDIKACRVGEIYGDKMGFIDNFSYAIGSYVTYILSDGTFAIVEEKSYSYDEEKSDCIIRRIVKESDCALLNLLDEYFDSDYQGLFDV